MEEQIRLGSIFNLVGGGTPSTSKEVYWGTGTPWFSSADISLDGKINYRRNVTPFGIQNSATNIVPAKTVVVVTRVGLGKVSKLPCDMCFSQDIQALQPTPQTPPFNESFLMYQLSHIMRRVKFQGRGTTISGITKKQLSDIILYLPPLIEQNSIVSRIEELFSQLDASMAELKTAKERLKVYRQAVLKEAFSHITEKKSIRQMSSIVTSGSRGWAQYYNEYGAKFIRIGNLTRDRIQIDLGDIQYVDLPDGAEGKRTRLQPNDVLVSITADLGSIGLVPDNIGEAYVNQHIAMIRFLNPAQGKLMAWYLRSDHGQKDLLKNKRGGGKLGLGLDDIRDSKVPVISDAEAAKILETIEARLSTCDSIEKTVDTALQQAEALRQSILKKAFEGGLV